MNLEEYITSGILESYAAGLLSEPERLVVESNLVRYPELKEELIQIEAAQEKLLMSAAISPRDIVKEKLLSSLNFQQPEGKIVPLQIENTYARNWKYAVAASVCIALVASYLAYDYRNKWLNTVVSLNEVINQNQQIAQDFNVVNNRITQIETDIKILNDPSFNRLVLAGTTNAPGAKAYLYWNEANKEVYLSLQNLRELSQESQYQLWAIVNGKPVDMGVFDGNVAGLLKMKEMEIGTVAFAVTIEPRGGKATPSLETMQVSGSLIKV